MNAPDKVYLGDGAYAHVEHEYGEVIITTENGIETTNRVVLGLTELVVLLNWLQAHGIIRWQMWNDEQS